MNKKEEKELGYFPYALDEALNKKFGKGLKAETSWNLFSGKHVTRFDAAKAKKGVTLREIQLFMEGYTAGNRELAERLLNLKHK